MLKEKLFPPSEENYYGWKPPAKNTTPKTLKPKTFKLIN
jgi:hypothetical protein